MGDECRDPLVRAGLFLGSALAAACAGAWLVLGGWSVLKLWYGPV